ncbi:hypothetical protein J437_LFUL003963, partial [Ladona fulva]
GVATLSSTDCSTSSGTSDITEPGSPYSSPSSAALRSPSSTASTSSSAASGSASSSASEESDDSRTGSPAIPQADPSSPQPSTPPEPCSPEAPSTPPPAPEEDEGRPPDPWIPSLWTDDRGRNVFGSQKRRFHSGGAFKSVSVKRPKPSSSSTYQGHFQSIIQCFQGKSTLTSTTAREEEQDEAQMVAPSRCAESQSLSQPAVARGQGKITEYFKTQMKPPSSKCTVRKDGRFGAGRVLSLATVEVSGSKSESGLVDKFFSFSSVEQSVDEDVVVEESSTSFVSERLESTLSEVKGLCASGRVGGVVRGPDAEGAESNDAPVVSATAVSSDTVEGSMPAPILSVPRTIRFPVVQRSSSSGDKSGGVISNGAAEPRPSAVCHWSECKQVFECGSKLMEHLQTKHVNSQVEASENFVCLWVGCKVYSRTSCSRSWLERHVLSHGGNKPFRCIFDGCGQRFSSQTMLERHVNGHFNVSTSGNGNSGNGQNGGAGAKRSLDATPNKAFRRNGKKLRYRRRPWSVVVGLVISVIIYVETSKVRPSNHRFPSASELTYTLYIEAKSLITTAVMDVEYEGPEATLIIDLAFTYVGSVIYQDFW